MPESLIRLCDEFNAACIEAVSSGPASNQSLRQLDDRLWGLTKDICKQIEEYGEGPPNGFRQEHFEPKVLKWCRSNTAVDNLWTKPSGYSGDYRTIETICSNQPSWTHFEDIFLNHLIRSEMADQHRSKVAEQSKFIVHVLNEHRRVKLLNAGCGPCFDLRLALQCPPSSEEPEVVLVDLDSEALSFSRQQLSEIRTTARFTFLNEHVLGAMRRLSIDRNERGTYDAVLFGGLFDYLPDRLVVLLLTVARRLLKIEGEIFFSQVSPNNPNRTFMKWYGDWQLRERDEEELLRLCCQAGYSASAVTFSREKTGIAVLAKLERRND